VEWQGPLANLTHTKCLACGELNCQEFGPPDYQATPPPVQSDQSPDAPQMCKVCGGYGCVSDNPDTPPNPAPGGSTVECGKCHGTGESPDTDRREKSESRAGIEPFQVNAERRAVDRIL
jgi:hypothetical protein